MNTKNTTKFNNIQDNYSKYRPSYSLDAIKYVLNKCNKKNIIIADIGAGTGKLSIPFLERNYKLFAIEPNKDMYNKCVDNLTEYKKAKVIIASAEDTSLEDNSIDIVIVGQAFHWFNLNKFLSECRRILKRDGYITIFYNNGDYTNKMMVEIDELSKKYCPDYKGPSGGMLNNEDAFKNFYSSYEKKEFNNSFELTLEQFIGLRLSTSYAPKNNNPIYEKYLDGLINIFNKYAVNNHITIPNKTVVRIGKL